MKHNLYDEQESSKMNFIVRYDNILPDNLLGDLIGILESNVSWHARLEATTQDKQLPLEPFWPAVAKNVNQELLNVTLKDYLDKFPCLKYDSEWTSGITILQKTSPMEGYHSWHCENSEWINNSRAIAWMIYLNTVEEGGETEFLYQQVKFKPTRNTALLWPGSWTHQHRGNPPVSGNKYILTGWYSPLGTMLKFKEP